MVLTFRRLTGRALLFLLPVAILSPSIASAQDGIPARAVFKTGQQLFDQCTKADQASIDICEWFMMGAYDMAVYYQDIGEIDATFCLPVGANAALVRSTVVSYWRAKPSSLKYSAVSTIINAMDAKYPGPCKEK